VGYSVDQILVRYLGVIIRVTFCRPDTCILPGKLIRVAFRRPGTLSLSSGGNQSGIFLDQIHIQYLWVVVRFAFSMELVPVHYPEVLDKVEYSLDQVP
jgi:hypothetical protein